jgi:hypothetical protein
MDSILPTPSNPPLSCLSLKDSWQLLQDFKQLPHLPDNNSSMIRTLIIEQDQPGAHDTFLAAMNLFGNLGACLEWESSGASHFDIFLTFTLKLNKNHYGVDTTQMYQKPMNLYLYGLPSSIQPPKHPLWTHLWNTTSLLLVEQQLA